MPSLQEVSIDARIYVKAFENKCYGYMIVIDDPLGTGKVKLLEFYIYEQYQKFGHGRVSTFILTSVELI